ncbi:NAD(+) diphosphatase [Nocardia puris]|uniref:NAD(+) diphosphatase n=1 Tax=Nocardia puris TaxID=208602 RepID=A0A366DQM3_9NOCA|nr:NAD(+) diphosphatase [Nocardia puris]MBF6211107.1 NAD(+) diphosphatase [Nocardia puris]MBF6364698.1 NAD(+) diphosphatase [Nocardia puris]MBF6463126.1 NAD(+) diphosphatase [Nocardia puris]RBO92387.1 NAD+ diphosphatase [Nocardia puris]
MSFQLNGIPLLSRAAVDRADELRTDEHALKEGWAGAGLLRVNRRGQVRFDGGVLVLEAAADLSAEPSQEAVFLGIAEGRHLWAVRDDALAGELTDLRALAAEIDDFTAGLLTSALALLNWHDKSRYSAYDGSRTTAGKAGWTRVTESGHEEFPRIDPAVICLIHDGGDRVLLARQHAWPSTLFSLLAGFVEAGESLERCVEREMREEVGLDVRDIHYLGSQPWPFPRSLMLGFAAVADPEQPLVFSDGEIAEAHWFGRDEVREALAAGDWSARRADARLLLPGSISIARTIVESWVGVA